MCSRRRNVDEERMTEKWLPVVGYEHLYDVSDLGRIRSCERAVVCDDGRSWVRPVKILSPYLDGHGYRIARFSVYGNMERKSAAAVVLEAFVGPRPHGYVVCHGPNGKHDDSLDNLSWGTWSKNMGADRIRDGADNRGSKKKKKKLNDWDVRDIRRCLSHGRSCREIAPYFSVSRQAISDIKFGRRWAWLE